MDWRQQTHRLSDADWAALQSVNATLTTLTVHHHHTCECELCQARALTDVQDEESRTVTYVPEALGRN